MNGLLEKLQLRLLMILNPQFVVIDFIKLVLISIFIFLTGYLFTRLLMYNGLKLNFLEVIGTSYLLGFGIIPFITLIISVLSLELQWLSLFIPILIIDIVLFSFTFPKNISLKALKTILCNFRRKMMNKRDVLFFFFIIYSIVFSLVLFPLFRGVYLGMRYDAGRYARAAEYILQGESPFRKDSIYAGEQFTFKYLNLLLLSYTLFYMLNLVSLAVLSGIGDARTVSYLFGPTFSISGLPLITYILLNQFRENNSLDRSLVKPGVFLVLFMSEEIVFWSLFGKGSIVAISYLFLSLHFFIKTLQRRGSVNLFAQKNKKLHLETILSGLFAGIASLYHMAAFVFVIIIAFFLVFEFLIFRREIKKILVPTVIFFSISIAISLIYWIPFLFIENFVPQISQQNANAGTTDRWNSLFIASNITQRLLYPFLFHYVPFVYPRSPLAHHYVFFGYGTAVLFVIALFSIFSNKTWIKSIEKRLLVSGFIVTYLFPLHSIVTRTFYFAPTRFVIFLELFSSLLVLVSFNKKLIKHENKLPFNKKLVNRYYILLTIIWLIVLFFTIRWYAYAIFYD